jgi:two-component system response regulator NreC
MNIILVEDCQMVREAWRTVCTTHFGHSVIGEADSGGEAVKLILSVQPDVVVLDLELADETDGFAVAEEVSSHCIATRFLAVSAYIDAAIIARMAKAPIHGFVDKSSSSLQSLRAGIEAVAAGKTYFSEPFKLAKLAQRADPNALFKILSDTEQMLLPFIGAGLSDHEIGQHVGIAPSTAKTHRRNILHKLGVGGTPKLMAFAVQHGFSRAVRRTHSFAP